MKSLPTTVSIRASPMSSNGPGFTSKISPTLQGETDCGSVSFPRCRPHSIANTLSPEATLQTLMKEGALTREPKQEHHWVTSKVIEKMIRAMFTDAIVNGTWSWDALLMKALSLLLQCFTGSRAGEIRRSRLYTGSECLC